jgi:nucleoid DNA-binding protein
LSKCKKIKSLIEQKKGNIMANKENSINEKEATDFIYESLKIDGTPETKTTIDRVKDKARDLSINALVQGSAIKVQGLGTFEIREHKATTYKTPKRDENGVVIEGEWLTGTVPAGKHVLFVESESLLDAMNGELTPSANPLL